MDGNDDPRQRGTAWMAKGGGIGGVGGGALEQPRQWTGRPVGRPLYPWECRAALSRQARPEEAQEPSWGAAAKGAALCACCGAAAAMRPLALHAAEVVVEYLRLPLLVERVLRGEDGVVWTAAGRARASRLDVLTPREVVGVWP